MLKLRNDPTLLSSYRPVSLIDTVGKPFGKILYSRVFRRVNEPGLLLGFRPRHSTTMQLACRVERVNRNCDEKGLTGADRHLTGQRPSPQVKFSVLVILSGEEHVKR
jgi:hypothetical protein